MRGETSRPFVYQEPRQHGHRWQGFGCRRPRLGALLGPDGVDGMALPAHLHADRFSKSSGGPRRVGRGVHHVSEECPVDHRIGLGLLGCAQVARAEPGSWARAIGLRLLRCDRIAGRLASSVLWPQACPAPGTRHDSRPIRAAAGVLLNLLRWHELPNEALRKRLSGGCGIGRSSLCLTDDGIGFAVRWRRSGSSTSGRRRDDPLEVRAETNRVACRSPSLD